MSAKSDRLCLKAAIGFVIVSVFFWEVVKRGSCEEINKQALLFSNAD
jgi:hypothetical protein